MNTRYIGIDVGAETIKLVELRREGGVLIWHGRAIAEHAKEPIPTLARLLSAWDFEASPPSSAAVSGRLSRQVNLTRIPIKQAQSAGFRFLHGNESATLVSIGSHGFSVLELRDGGVEVMRENSRCSQGTGNFLRQLVERFDLDIQAASDIATSAQAAPLSGRCPVILKTDMTHLANKGENRAKILAGLFDAVCENVEVLIKPGVSPPRVALIGGVSRAPRARNHFQHFVTRRGMTLLPYDGDAALYMEALGCAVLAAEKACPVPRLSEIFAAPRETELDRVPALSAYLPLVTRMKSEEIPPLGEHRRELVLGFDIGSTGSKVVAVDAATRQTLWEGYIRTNGTPVGAAQSLMKMFLDGPAGKAEVVGVGATGSGREIVGSLMSICFGCEAVYVLNEIAAHAEGALHFDRRVDTIFEIGGQDAKYIRLMDGRVIDAAMNEACSAGTGSFIEEQGRKFAGIKDVAQLANEALCSSAGVSLGQHCSVFMAEIIDEAVAAGVEQPEIISGIYDFIIQNYLNRVKGGRSVGSVIFCQGMPFSADALAAAVARQTGSHVIIPPNPGTVGALGIALLLLKAIPPEARRPLETARFLDARVENKDTFVCKATQGCGGAGNKCRIDRITTRIEDQQSRFTWGGGCSLWDKGTLRKKLPDLAPDPFRERDELMEAIVARTTVKRGRPRVALTDEFLLKGLLPFMATFLHELGFDPVITMGADHAALKRGIERANVPWCAPMQQYIGVVGEMAEAKDRPDFILLPMLRELPRMGQEPYAVACPIVQGSADILKLDLPKGGPRILSPVIDIGVGNLASPSFQKSCERLAVELGVPVERIAPAHRIAARAQAEFEEKCFDLGRRALAFCAEQALTPVVVLGRAYTIHNQVLNSNVPAILREQGAIAIPVDCYPVDAGVPIYEDVFWGYGQRSLRAAHQIRRIPGIYSLYCSNYSCGPDSFVLHFYSYLMEGKPFAIIETDGHSGDAGTKTRVEAFLHCVREDLSAMRVRRPQSLKALEVEKASLPDIRRREEKVLLPRMGPGADAVAAALRGVGVPAEGLPLPTRSTLSLGRRHTSGKECVPMTISLGSLLERLEQDRDSEERFAFFMPTAEGPCRFGVYNLLYKITLERLGWKDRVRVWSPSSSGYFDGIPGGFTALIFAALMAADLLLDALHDVRPVEAWPGAAQSIYDRWKHELEHLLETGSHDLSVGSALLEVANGHIFGITELLRKAASEFAAAKTQKDIPTVLMVGEIYVRLDPFANDFVVEKLEQRGLRVKIAPFNEWLEYTDLSNLRQKITGGFSARLASITQSRIQELTTKVMAGPLGWTHRTSAAESIDAGSDYIREDLLGEAVLTIGGPVHEWRAGLIDAVVSVGPHECMPNKLAESQFFHAAQKEGLLSLTLPLNGDPIDPEVLDNFAFEVHTRYRKKDKGPPTRMSVASESRRMLGRLADLPGATKLLPVARLIRKRWPGNENVL